MVFDSHVGLSVACVGVRLLAQVVNALESSFFDFLRLAGVLATGLMCHILFCALGSACQPVYGYLSAMMACVACEAHVCTLH